MNDVLDTLAQDAVKTIESGYYRLDLNTQVERPKNQTLSYCINRCVNNPIITELKFSSPSGFASETPLNIEDIAASMIRGGATAISVITEPNNFKGSLHTLIRVRKFTHTPLLMKDFIISQVQLDIARQLGADAVLFIQSLFDRGYSKLSLDEMITYAHSRNIEVLLETHTRDEFRRALASQADLVGINNRDLKTLDVDLNTTLRLLKKNNPGGRIIVSESGIKSPEHIRLLRRSGATAFLVGGAVMSSRDIEGKVRQLVEA
ncbi:indole-3-glycerol-phosphate synthase [[Eubacterium] cellulosolvens]